MSFQSEWAVSEMCRGNSGWYNCGAEAGIGAIGVGIFHSSEHLVVVTADPVDEVPCTNGLVVVVVVVIG